MQCCSLVETLGANDNFEVDIGSLLLHVHRLILLARPLVKVVRFLELLRRWEYTGLCISILLGVNLGCAILPSAYYMTLVVMLIVGMASLGMMHRHTRCLVKVFPPVHAKVDQMGDGGPLTHQQLLQCYKGLLHRVDECVESINENLVSFYGVLKWESIQVSARCYLCVVLTIICLHLAPLRWSLVLIVNIFFLEAPVAKVIIQRIVKQKPPERQCSLKAMMCSDDWMMQDLDSPECISFDSQMTPPSDTESEVEEAQEVEGDVTKFEDDSSGSEVSDSEVSSTTTTEGGDVKATKSGVVGKILEFKKKHQSSATGSCAKCNVNFTAILKRRHTCSHCGDHFCSRCCNRKVPRSLFGATSPAAQTETVPVCSFCYMYLTGQKEKVT